MKTQCSQKSIFIWNNKRPCIVTAILKRNKCGGITFSNFKLDYKAIIIKHFKNRYTDKCKRIKNPEMDKLMIN